MVYFPKLKIKFEKIDEDAIIPTYATIGDSGMDVYAIEDYLVEPGESVLVRTGLKVEIPIHPHHRSGYRWEMQVRPRSGVSLKTNLRVANSPGTVDNFYRDEIRIIVHNANFDKVEFEAEGNRFYINPKMVDFARLINGLVVDTDIPVPFGSYWIKKGDRIAQIVFNQIVRPSEVVEGPVSDELSRGSSFGGTGIN